MEISDEFMRGLGLLTEAFKSMSSEVGEINRRLDDIEFRLSKLEKNSQQQTPRQSDVLFQGSPGRSFRSQLEDQGGFPNLLDQNQGFPTSSQPKVVVSKEREREFKAQRDTEMQRFLTFLEKCKKVMTQENYVSFYGHVVHFTVSRITKPKFLELSSALFIVSKRVS